MKKLTYLFSELQHKKTKLSLVLLLGMGLIGLQAQNTISTSGGNASGSFGALAQRRPSFTTIQLKT
jgi:hypothetical protein